jgi:hypothetical protein
MNYMMYSIMARGHDEKTRFGPMLLCLRMPDIELGGNIILTSM